MSLDGLDRLDGPEAVELLVALKTYRLGQVLRSRAEDGLHTAKDKVFSFVRDTVRSFDATLSERVEGVRRTLDWNTASLDGVAAEGRRRFASLEPSALKGLIREELSLLAGAHRSIAEDGAFETQVRQKLSAAFQLDPGEAELEEKLFSRFMIDLEGRVAQALADLPAEPLEELRARMEKVIGELSPQDRSEVSAALGTDVSTKSLIDAMRSEPSLRPWGRSAETHPRGAFVAAMLVTHAFQGGVMGAAPAFSKYGALAAAGALFLRMPMVTLAALAGAGYLYKKAEEEQNARLLAFGFASLYAKERWSSGPSLLKAPNPPA